MTNQVPTILDLNDIVEPGAVGIWPLAPTLAAFLALAIAGLLFVTVAAGLRRHRSAYRREALSLLKAASDKDEIMVLLKRVALVGWPRESVAPLHGDDWIDFLNRNCTRCRFKPDAELQELVSQASEWIRHHRRPNPC